MKIAELYTVHPIHLNGDVLQYVNLKKVNSMTLESGMVSVKTNRQCILVPLVNISCIVRAEDDRGVEDRTTHGKTAGK